MAGELLARESNQSIVVEYVKLASGAYAPKAVLASDAGTSPYEDGRLMTSAALNGRAAGAGDSPLYVADTTGAGQPSNRFLGVAPHLYNGGGTSVPLATPASGVAVAQLTTALYGTLSSTGDAPIQATAEGDLLVRIGGHHARIPVTPVLSLVAYTVGDFVGGVLEFPNAARAAGLGGQIRSITITDRTKRVTNSYDIVFFSQTLTSPVADNEPVSIDDADLANYLAHINFGTGDWIDLATNTVGVRHSLSTPYTCTGTSLFARLIVRNTAHTYATASDLIVTLHVVPA